MICNVLPTRRVVAGLPPGPLLALDCLEVHGRTRHVCLPLEVATTSVAGSGHLDRSKTVTV